MAACEVHQAGGSLWVGDWQDALVWVSDEKHKRQRLCVLESPYKYPGLEHHVPILEWPIGAQVRSMACPDQLDAASNVITAALASGLHLLVHCAAGIERSPLTCAWWLRRAGHVKTLSEAYERLQAVRPIVADRRGWLPPERQ